MTVQDLLSQASQLSVPEQIHLAAQLLQLVEQQVTSPSHPTAATPEPNLSDRSAPEVPGSINYLMANPIPVSNFKPLPRDEIYDRS